MYFRRLVAEEEQRESERERGEEERNISERERERPRVVLVTRDNGAGLSVCWIT